MTHVLAIIVLVVVVGFALKGLSDPFFGLMGLVAVYEIQPGEIYPMLAPLHLERVLAALLLISFLAHSGRFRCPPLTKRLLAFYGAMIVAVPLAFWRGNSVATCIAFFSIIFYHLMLVSMLKTEAQVRKILVLFVALAAWLGGSAVWEYHQGVLQFTMGIDRAEGITSAGGDPNSLATTMVVTMPLMFLLMSKGNPKWMRLFGLVCFGIGLVTVITTGSRTAFLAFLLLLFMMVFREAKNLKFLPLLLVALPLFWLAIPQQYKLRYESVKTRNQDESYTDRLLSWEGGWHMFLDNPLTGVGPGNYTVANGEHYWPAKRKVWLNAHSLYFKVLGELGAIGVITFGAYVYGFIQLNRSLGKRYRGEEGHPILQKFGPFCNLSVILLLFSGYSAHDLYRVQWYTFGAISAAVALLKVEEPETEPKLNAKEGRRAVPLWLPQSSDSYAEPQPMA